MHRYASGCAGGWLHLAGFCVVRRLGLRLLHDQMKISMADLRQSKAS